MIFPNDKFPVIETERLRLREVCEEDYEMVYVLRSDPEMMKFIPRPLCEDYRDALKLIRQMKLSHQNKESLNWVMTLKDSDELIGTVGYVRIKTEHNRAELGYMLHSREQGKGYMKEAVAAVINYGFKTMDLHSIEAIIDPGNTASENILLHFGFEKEGHFKENFLFEGKYLDSVCYGLLKR
ncbi:MAG: GNAT family N-acetyltransferase [Chitinophagaceae bacterium]